MTYQPKHSQYAAGRVSDMLHTLRGEQFRHSQNLNRSNDSLSTINAQNTLTTRLLNLDYSSPETYYTLSSGAFTPGTRTKVTSMASSSSPGRPCLFMPIIFCSPRLRSANIGMLKISRLPVACSV
ncbi:hypothetical protein LENED_002750 [Lentinula edodes]|uniref:Uncharacterized protein n=1 Tax=Lentinula edodes TaxID=5353 RepID=A0A1Q3E2A3_LENED|nr:hypothetical protein LENED_002750 [Lentinula edodes]